MFIDILKRWKLTIFFEIEYFQSFGTGYTILYVVFLTEMIPLVLAKNTYRSIPVNARRKALSSLLLFYCENMFLIPVRQWIAIPYIRM